jgi:hypothetical protein
MLSEQNGISRNLMLRVLHTEYRSGGQFKVHEMGGTHGTPGAEEIYVTEFVRGSLRKEITAKT